MQHLCVLPGHSRTQHGEHSGGQAKVNGQAINVTRACACTGSQDHFVPAKVGYDFIHQRIYGATSAIHDALAANLDHVDPWQYGEVRCGRSRLLDGSIRQRAGEQLLAQCSENAVFIVDFVCHWITSANPNPLLSQNSKMSSSKHRSS